MFVRAIALAIALASATLPAPAVTPVVAPSETAGTMTTEELMQATALDKIFDSYAETIAQSPTAQGTPLPKAFLAAWEETALDVFRADVLHAQLASSLEGTLTAPELTELAAFFRSDFGKRITEIESVVPQLSMDEQLAAVDEGIAIIESLAPGATRDRQISEIMDLVSAEVSRSMVGEAMRALLVSMSVSGATGDIEVPWDEIDAQLAQILPGVEAEVLNTQRALMAYAYRDISDDDLETYIQFLRTEVSQKFYVLVGRGVGAIMTNSMSRFGEQLAHRLNQVNV